MRCSVNGGLLVDVTQPPATLPSTHDEVGLCAQDRAHALRRYLADFLLPPARDPLTPCCQPPVATPTTLIFLPPRSLAACEVLSRAGYRSLAWINGGYDTAQPGELPVEGDVDVRLAGIGGLSSVLGWTEPQREGQGGGFAGGFQNILKGVAVILLLDVLLFGWELIQASKQ